MKAYILLVLARPLAEGHAGGARHGSRGRPGGAGAHVGGTDGSHVVLAAGGGVRAGGGVESRCKSVKAKIFRKITLILLTSNQDNCYICNVINERLRRTSPDAEKRREITRQILKL